MKHCIYCNLYAGFDYYNSKEKILFIFKIELCFLLQRGIACLCHIGQGFLKFSLILLNSERKLVVK